MPNAPLRIKRAQSILSKRTKWGERFILCPTHFVQPPSSSGSIPCPAPHRHRRQIQAIVDDLRPQGINSVRSIAAELNERGILTAWCGMAPHAGCSAAVAVAISELTAVARRRSFPFERVPFAEKSQDFRGGTTLSKKALKTLTVVVRLRCAE
jgi:hypothetical protein